MKRKSIIRAIAGVGLAALGLYIFLRGDDAVFEALGREISNTNAAALAVCGSLAIFVIWLRALRLRVMLPDKCCDCGASQHKRGLFGITIVSFMLNNILPARLGEAARVALLWKRNGYPVTVSLGALIVERALDIAAYLSFLFVPVFLSPAISAGLRSMNPLVMIIIWIALILFVFLAALFFAYALTPMVFRRMAKRICDVCCPKRAALKASIGKIASEVESSVGWIFSARKAAAVVSLTFATALCYAVILILLVGRLGSFGVLEGMFGQAFAAFGSAIPLAPGHVGTLHAALLQGLVAVGVEADRARAVTVIYHGLQYVVITVTGLLFFAGMHVKIKDITADRPSR